MDTTENRVQKEVSRSKTSSVNRGSQSSEQNRESAFVFSSKIVDISSIMKVFEMVNFTQEQS